MSIAYRGLESFRLSGRVAIVTGASQGLGEASARALCGAGADVVLLSRNRERLETLARELITLNGNASVVTADVSSRTSCMDAVSEIVTQHEQVDVLVNCAGQASAVPASRESEDEFDAILRTNLYGAYWMSQAVHRHMPVGSSIINFTSILGLISAGLPQAAYSSSKAGLIGLTRDLAGQWTRRKGIRVNAIAPGFIHTPMTDRYVPGYLEAQTERIPVGRVGEPGDIAGTVLWLASDASLYVTGQTIVIDGGRTIT